MSEELKACPFCGGEGHLLEQDGRYIIECEDQCYGMTTEAKAISAWNRRAGESAEVERLREALAIETGAHSESVRAHLFYMGRSKQFQERAEKAEAELVELRRNAKIRADVVIEDHILCNCPAPSANTREEGK